MSDEKKAEIDQLLADTYGELRKVARGYMARERQGHTLQPTELVHAAYHRVLKLRKGQYESREMFLRVISAYMRRHLVDHARGRRADKRGAGAPKVEFDEELPVAVPDDESFDSNAFLNDLGEALVALRAQDERSAHAVELRFLAQMTVQQTADELGVSTGTVKRDLEFGRAWLSSWLTKNANVQK